MSQIVHRLLEAVVGSVDAPHAVDDGPNAGVTPPTSTPPLADMLARQDALLSRMTATRKKLAAWNQWANPAGAIAPSSSTISSGDGSPRAFASPSSVRAPLDSLRVRLLSRQVSAASIVDRGVASSNATADGDQSQSESGNNAGDDMDLRVVFRQLQDDHVRVLTGLHADLHYVHRKIKYVVCDVRYCMSIVFYQAV